MVGIDGRLVYETIIRPDDTIIDYNTRFSGVTARDLKRGNNSVKSLKDVQNDLLGFINANTILIGHGLENDLRALKVSSGKIGVAPFFRFLSGRIIVCVIDSKLLMYFSCYFHWIWSYLLNVSPVPRGAVLIWRGGM